MALARIIVTFLQMVMEYDRDPVITFTDHRMLIGVNPDWFRGVIVDPRWSQFFSKHGWKEDQDFDHCFVLDM